MSDAEQSTLPAQLILIASVPLELDPVRKRLHHMRELTIGRKPAWSGVLAGRRVLLLQGGMGKSNTAHALTAALERSIPHAVLNFGVGGAYPGSGLQVGGVAIATADIYADEGVSAPGGWLTTREMGIALVSDTAGTSFNDFPLDAGLATAASAALEDAGIDHLSGPFATVSACSGTEARGRELASRLGALVETMEGAACAHIARIYGVPCLQIRAISNLVEDRDPSRWRLDRAAARAARAVEQIVACW